MDVGRIEAIRQDGEHTHMLFSTALPTEQWRLGDSVAVDGCCLTITDLPATGRWQATLSAETLALTHFSSARVGQRVNMEPALHLGDALGGHMVTGHVDGLATVTGIEQHADHRGLSFQVAAAFAPLIVHKGSVALNGVSLTVNTVKGCVFSVNLIPHTLAHTNLGDVQQGDCVNMETDILGRYVRRMLECGVMPGEGA